MASRYGPGVLPGYYGGDPASEIADALGSYIELQRQKRFDDLAAKGQEVDLLRAGYRPDAPIPPAPDISGIEIPGADEVAANVRGTSRGVPSMEIGPRDIGDPADEAAQLLEERRRASAADPAVPQQPGPPPGSIARQIGTQFFQLANGGYFVPGASERDRQIREERGYADRVRSEENTRADRVRSEDRSFETKLREKEAARELERLEMERAARAAQAAEDRAFEERMLARRTASERALIEARGAEERSTLSRRAELEAGAGGVEDEAWEERRASAVALLGKPLTPLQQDMVDALADGETPTSILTFLAQQGADEETLTAARLYLSPANMGFRGNQNPRPRSGQF